MQFKHPEILYALFLLIIPIIVHLFQLRRFKKVPFTNVQFLKEVELQTRKSSRLKKLLILFTRLALFTALIFAFAQPFLSKEKNELPANNYIYLDNSFSMQAKGKDGELLKRASQDIIENISELDKIHLFTNNQVFKNLSLKDIKNTLLSVDYHPVKMDIQSVLLRMKASMNDNDKINNVFLISDFQESNNLTDLQLDSINNFFITKLVPVNLDNVSIDSVYIANQNNENLTLKVHIRRYGDHEENTSISLYNGEALSGKSSVNFDENGLAEVLFTMPNSTAINGRLQLEDSYLNFDNTLFFTYSRPLKINVTAVGKENGFLSKIYTENEFNFINTQLSDFDYNSVDEQHLIVLNELENLPGSLIDKMKEFVEKNGNLVIIPPGNARESQYNNVLSEFTTGRLAGISEEERAITGINFSHPLLQGVFEKQIANFQYPKVQSHYKSTIGSSASSLLNFENGDPFVSQINSKGGSVYWFSSAISEKNSNFKSSPLIVPIFYNFGLYSFKQSALYYTMGKRNTFEVAAILKKDEVLHLTNAEENFIPLQQISEKKVTLTTEANPVENGFVAIRQNEKVLQNIAFNYDRTESNLSSFNFEDAFDGRKNITFIDTVNKAFSRLIDNYKITQLWQLFLSLALLFLVVEILLLKFLRS